MRTISISTGAPYEVVIGEHLLATAGETIYQLCHPKRAVVVTDSNVSPLYLRTVLQSFPAEVEVRAFVAPAGEATKCQHELFRLLDFLCEARMTRTDLLVALGGGVIGDLTGFAASIYLRGIPFVQIPTTLLAQVDASVGGKTAIDLPAGKNLVGSFYQPKLVLCDTGTLKTLSPTDFASGMAEVIKYAAIYDKRLFDLLRHRPLEAGHLIAVIARCVELKAAVVAKDEFDTGERMMLNFGHTIGHAVEQYHHYTDYTHGQGVAIGMVTILSQAEKRGMIRQGLANEVRALCKLWELPTDCDVPTEEIERICALDKKSDGQRITIVLLREIGEGILLKFPRDEFCKFVEA